MEGFETDSFKESAVAYSKMLVPPGDKKTIRGIQDVTDSDLQ